MKNLRMLGVNHNFEGDPDNVNLQDLIDFLKKNEIDPARVPVKNFIAFIPAQ